MKLISQILNKKFQLYNELMLNRSYLRGVWNFYSCYFLSLAILGIEDVSYAKKRRRIYSKLIKGWLESKFNLKGYKELDEMMRKDVNIILKAMKLLDKQNEELGYELGDIYRPYCVGVASFEIGI